MRVILFWLFQKERSQAENESTSQAFSRVMAEANQLRAALQQQRVLLAVDNSDALQHGIAVIFIV